MWRDVLSLLVLAVGLVLLIPKRGWRTIPARLRALAAGERHYLFGPPRPAGDLDVGGWFDAVRRDWRRVIELGVPLYILATVVEIRGSGVAAVREEVWRQSELGLLRDHLTGRDADR
jgi:hypothetical protein